MKNSALLKFGRITFYYCQVMIPVLKQNNKMEEFKVQSKTKLKRGQRTFIVDTPALYKCYYCESTGSFH